MALFTDGAPADIAYLRAQESSIEQVAATEAIDLDAKLAITAEQIGQELLEFLLLQGPPAGQARRCEIGVSDVVVTPALRRWHALETIAAVYRDAYNSQLNDRYAGKWKQFRDSAREARDRAFEIGIGLVWRPVRKAATPEVVSVSDPPSRQDYWLRVTWSNEAGIEGTPSDPVPVSLGPGDIVRVTAVANSTVAGWHVYAGTTADTVEAQNEEAIGIGNVWVMSGLHAGRPAGNGQAPDFFVAERRILLRG
jgi:hypothetical protein